MPDRPPLLSDESAVGFIGAGRFGTSLAVALQRSGYQVVAVASRSRESARELSSRVPGCFPLDHPSDVADAADVVFVTTPDAAISAVAGSVGWRRGQAVVHPSGALPVAILQPAARAGAVTGGFHILQTFPNRDSADLIAGAACAVDASGPALLEWLETAAGAVSAKPFRIRDEHRAAYHASAIMSCGLIAAMLGLAAELWRPMGVSRGQAIRALRPLAAATVREVGLSGLPDAFTGPFVRGDVGTVARHLEALAAYDRDTARAYAAIGLAGLPLFAEHRGLSGEAAAQIAALLARELAEPAGPDGPGAEPDARSVEPPRDPAPKGREA